MTSLSITEHAARLIASRNSPEYHGVAICEDENSNFIYAYGHRDKTVMARAINSYDREVAGESYGVTPDAVVHKWAVTHSPADAPDGWFINWGGITQDTPGAFAITVVAR